MKESTRKRTGWTVLVLVVALWVFIVFFFDAILAHYARIALIDAVATSTNAEYQLSFQQFTYHQGVIHADGTDMRRVAYRTGEQGTTLRDLTIDSTVITGIQWWKILFGKPIALSLFKTDQSKLYLCTIDQGKGRWKLLPPYVAPPPTPSKDLTVSFDDVVMPGIWLYGQDRSEDRASGAASIRCKNFRYDSKSNALLHLEMSRFDLNVPWIRYSDSSVSCSLSAARVTSLDSLLTVDTFAYTAGTGSLALSGSGIRGAGIQFLHAVLGKGLSLRSLQTRSWAVEVTPSTDTTQRRSTLPWQDQVAHSVSFPIVIDTLDLVGGALDVHLPHSGRFDARGLGIHALSFDLDSGAPARRPCFSRVFTVAAQQANYIANNAGAYVTNLDANIQDSLVTAGSLSYDPSAHPTARTHTAPIQFQDVRMDGIGFDSLFAGSEVTANSLTAHGWKVLGLPAASGAKSKKASQSIWEVQHQIATAIAMPVRIGRIDLMGGTVRVEGKSSPSILADGASIDAVRFNLDSTKSASNSLLFSKDIDVKAGRFQYRDQSGQNVVDLHSAHSRLSRRSVTAGVAEYISRSAFEPAINNTSFRFNDLDLAGIDLPSLFANKKISLESARTRSWAITSNGDTTTPPSHPKKPAAPWTETIKIGHASLPNGTLLFRQRDTTPGGYSPTLNSKVSTLDVTDFRFLPPKGKRPRLAFGQVVVAVPTFSYDQLGGFYRFNIHNLQGNLRNSTVTMDSLCYSPKYSEDEFAARHPYASARTDFRLAPVRISGIDTKQLIAGEAIDIRSIDAPSVWVDYYDDKRKPADPHPPPPMLPHDMIRRLNYPFTVDSLEIEDGDIQIREHTVNSAPPGNFAFQHVKLSATPITLDSASPLIDTPTQFNLNGVFIAQAPTQATVIYALHDSTLNLSLDGTVGAFDIKQLNTYLVNSARVEVTQGAFTKGEVALRIKGDAADSKVVPVYDHLKIKVLPPDANDPSDIREAAITLLANSLVLHNDNPDEMKGAPKVGTTKLTRQPTDEFFQFLWLAIRKSLGAVVGGM